MCIRSQQTREDEGCEESGPVMYYKRRDEKRKGQSANDANDRGGAAECTHSVV